MSLYGDIRISNRLASCIKRPSQAIRHIRGKDCNSQGVQKVKNGDTLGLYFTNNRFETLWLICAVSTSFRLDGFLTIGAKKRRSFLRAQFSEAKQLGTQDQVIDLVGGKTVANDSILSRGATNG